MLRRAIGHQGHIRTHATDQGTAEIDKACGMKHVPNRTDDTISRSHLRSYPYVRVTSSVRKSTRIKTKHVAHPLKSGMANAEFGLTGPIQPNGPISPISRAT